MILALLAFLGGALTILSPCILPVLPFVFARSEQPFAKSTLPLLIGMALTFAGIATLAAVGGGWAVNINTYGRIFALILLAAFGVALLSRRLADLIARPFVSFGNRLLQSNEGGSVAQSLILGVATGFLWAPCAGPILGLILTGAAINGPNTGTTLLLFSYALGAIASLAIATLAGGRVFALLKKSFGAGEWVRRGLGVAVIVAVVAIALGWDTGVLTRLSTASTGRFEQSLLDSFPANDDAQTGAAMTGNGAMSANGAMTGNSAMTGGNAMKANGAMTNSNAMAMSGSMAMSGKNAGKGLPVEGDLPPLTGAVSWINSQPLTAEQLRGKVVVIDFWTYSCINCLRALPYVKTWYDRYKDQGLVVIGVHAPEFAFEKNENNVKRAVKEFDIRYPVALDNNYAIWQAFNNQYWPAHYFIDADGKIRGHHFGEGEYDESEKLIRELLTQAGKTNLPQASDVKAAGVQAAADEANVQSPETYVGFGRAENFASPGSFDRDKTKTYSVPAKLQSNQWALGGAWTVEEEKAVSAAGAAKIAFEFHARDLHLVLGPASGGKPIRFKVTIDGKAPAGNHGMDIDADGNGVVKDQRLYQLIRQSKDVANRTFTIEFLDSGVQAYSFTFG